MREVFLEDDEIRLILSLLRTEEVPEGLDPTFYLTLTYEGDVKLHNRMTDLRDRLTWVIGE